MKAKCLCGSVSLEVEHDRHVHACHCRMCRTWGSGASFSLTAVTPPEIDGGGNIALYRSSEWGERAFCKNCGTHLFYRFLPENSYFVFAGLFEDDAGFTLAQQIYADSQAPYGELAADTPKLTEQEFLAQFGG